MGSLAEEMKHLCGIPIIVLTFLIGYPPSEGKFNIKRLLLLSFCPVYCVYTAVYSAIGDWPDILEMALDAGAIVCATMLTLRFSNYMIYRKEYAKLFIKIEQDFWEKNEESSEEEKDILRSYGRLFYILSFCTTVLFVTSAFIWTYEPIAQMLGILPKRQNHQEDLVLGFDLWLPDKFDKHAHPLFDFLFIIQAITTQTCGFLLPALDCLFGYLVMNLCAQYRLLQHRLINFTKYETDLKKQELFIYRCIEHHQNLCNFGNDLEVCVNKSILLQFFFSVEFLCVSGVYISLVPEDTYNVVRNIYYIIGAMLQLFIYCYTSETLTTACFQVSHAAYNSDWFESSDNVKKLLFFIILRAQKPFHLTAWKFAPANLESFETVVRTACSYFAIFNSVREN